MKHYTDSSFLITTKEMVDLLNGDLAREYQSIIAYTSCKLEKYAEEELTHALKIVEQIKELGGTPTAMPEPVPTLDNQVDSLLAALASERETVAHYHQRINQAEALQQTALNEMLHEIMAEEQRHEIDLCWQYCNALASQPKGSKSGAILAQNAKESAHCDQEK